MSAMRVQRNTGAAIRSLVMLAVVLQLGGYVQLNLTQAHLHWASGQLVAHWHPQSTNNQSMPKPGDVPLSGHSHSLCDIFELLGPEKTLYFPGEIECGELIVAADYVILQYPSADEPVQAPARTDGGRSPPAVVFA